MKLPLTLIIALLSLLLTGCATTIRSDVSVFHEWPTALPDKSFVFEALPSHQSNHEYGIYQDLIRDQLVRLGFSEVKDGATLKVTTHYSTTPVEVRTVQPVYSHPFWAGSYRAAGFWHPWYHPGWDRYGFRHGYGYGYGRYYDPFWFGPPITYLESTDLRYQYQLQVSISHIADDKKLYEVTVDNHSRRTVALKTVIPYMIKSAFAQFPGKSGETYHVQYEVEKKGKGGDGDKDDKGDKGAAAE
jgi:hypothetical protein